MTKGKNKASEKVQTPSEFTQKFFEEHPHLLEEFLRTPKFVKELETLDHMKYLCKLSDKQNSYNVKVPKTNDKIYVGGWARMIASWHDKAIKMNLSDEAHIDYVNKRIHHHHEGAIRYKKFIDSKTSIILPQGVH